MFRKICVIFELVVLCDIFIRPKIYRPIFINFLTQMSIISIYIIVTLLSRIYRFFFWMCILLHCRIDFLQPESTILLIYFWIEIMHTFCGVSVRKDGLDVGPEFDFLKWEFFEGVHSVQIQVGMALWVLQEFVVKASLFERQVWVDVFNESCIFPKGKFIFRDLVQRIVLFPWVILQNINLISLILNFYIVFL